MYLPSEQAPKVVPAQLGFLAIYNPSLGTTDETLENQIVYYSSSDSRYRSRQRAPQKPDDDALREEKNEQLRQIGLAQGMVEFGRSFSDGRAVDTVETEKSRIVLHELEAGWWILAVSDSILQKWTLLTAFLVNQPNSTPNHNKDFSWERQGYRAPRDDRILLSRGKACYIAPGRSFTSTFDIPITSCLIHERPFCAHAEIKICWYTGSLLGHFPFNVECPHAWQSGEQPVWGD
jgi:hypothetical protein